MFLSVLWSLLLLGMPPEDHAIYLSVIEIESTETMTELTIKVFRDDMIDALRNNQDTLVSTISVLDEIEVQSYFGEKIVMLPRTNNPLNMDRYTVEGDSFFIRMTTKRPLNSIMELSVGHFFELFPGQKNIVKIIMGEEQSYHVFDKVDQIEMIHD